MYGIYHYACKLCYCINFHMLHHYNTISDGVFIRDLCLLRETNIVVDDMLPTSTEIIIYLYI